MAVFVEPKPINAPLTQPLPVANEQNGAVSQPTPTPLPTIISAQRRERLEHKLSKLYEHYDLETRIEEKLRLENLIAETRQQLAEL